jgi:23S rRNA-/tRNA-specific pseudouridylate synthase
VAADQSTYERLRRAFASGSARKQYLALVAGSVAEEFTIDIPLARRSTHVVRARRTDRSMSARTRVEPIDCGPGWSLVRAEICTGVTHQVRAHLAMVGHPLLGDRKYGGPPGPTVARRGQLLHASRLSIADTIDVSADVPADFRRAYEHLRNERAGTGESSD